MGLDPDPLDEGDGRLMASIANKIAFCFPGQGSIEAGMGLDIAEAVPEAMDVYRRGSSASGLDLEHLCFRGSADALVDTAVQQPALVATSLAMLAAIRARGIEPDFVVGHSVGEFAAIAAAGSMSVEEALELVRERGIAMAEAAAQHPGSMAAILGLEDEVVETLCRKILGVWPANYNCPGQIVVSGENDAVDECCERAQEEGARRAVKLKVSGAFHSPLVARAADRLRPAIETRELQGAAVALHVDRDGPGRVRATDGPASRRPAHRARALHPGGDRVDEGRRAHLRRGRPGQRALRARQAHRPQRQGRLGERPRFARQAPQSSV